MKTKQFFLNILCVFILSACQSTMESMPLPANESNQTQPTPQISDPPVISPQNIDQLEITDRWGKGDLFGVALSPDEKTLAVATDTGVYLYSFPDLQQISYLDIVFHTSLQNERSLDNILSFSPDGKQLAVLGEKILYFWDLEQDKEVYRTNTYIAGCPPIEIAYSPNGESLVMVGNGRCQHPDGWSGNYALYDVQNHEIIYQHSFLIEGTPGHFFRFINENRVAFVEEDKNLRIVDTKNGALLFSHQYNNPISSISNDGNLLGIQGWNENYVVDTYSAEIIEHTEQPIYFIPDSLNRILADYQHFSLANRNNETICIFPETFDPSTSNEIVLNGRMQGDYLPNWNSTTQNVEIWDVTQCRLYKTLAFPYYDFQTNIQFGKNGKQIISKSDTNINILDSESGEVLSTIPLAPNQYSYYKFQFIDKTNTLMFITRGEINQVGIFTLDPPQEIKHFNIPERIFGAVFSPTENYVLIDSGTNRDVWDVENETIAYSLPDDKSKYFISPDGTQFARLSKNALKFYRLGNGTFIRQIYFPTPVPTIAFSDDWSMFFVSGDTRGEIWSLDGTKITTLWDYSISEIDPRTGNLDDQVSNDPQWIYSAVFSPDHQMLALEKSITYELHVIEFWDLKRGEKCHEIMNTGYTQIHFSPDGKKFYSMMNHAIYVWGIPEK